MSEVIVCEVIVSRLPRIIVCEGCCVCEVIVCERWYVTKLCVKFVCVKLLYVKLLYVRDGM